MSRLLGAVFIFVLEAIGFLLFCLGHLIDAIKRPTSKVAEDTPSLDQPTDRGLSKKDDRL